MRHLPRSIVITGASSGLGRALALQYGGTAHSLGLLGRDRTRLQAVAAECRALGTDASIGAFDLSDTAALNAWMQAFDAAHTIDLLIVNAGAFSGNGSATAMETSETSIATLRVNLEAAIRTVQAAVPMLRSRRSGHVAIVGSLAALQPLADAPTYSASKAGLMSYGEALREWLAPDNVAVSLVYPGHIATGQTRGHIGSLPLMLTADEAAARIKRGLDRRQSFIAFPRRLLWLIRAGRLLPWRTRSWFGRGLRFHVDEDANRHR
ncbi:MAG: SDR family NAD(P)-dependent oxidoreductase [Hyphomicrobium sp.]